MKEEKKVAILFHANLADRKGQTNATLSRIKHLKCALPEDITADAICTSYYDGKFLRLLRKKNRLTRCESQTIDGVNINIEWRKFSLLDYILKFKFHKAPLFQDSQLNRIIARLKGYDLISAHSFLAGEMALKLYKDYNIPYCVTWHGSDIHTMPFESEFLFSKVRDIIENATTNFFVSAALLDKSNQITVNGKKIVLYNGVSNTFSQLTNDDKLRLKEVHSLSNDNKVVAFVGNLIPVKNASLLPNIFKGIKEHFQEGVEFWIIGNGPLRDSIGNDINKLGLSSDVKFFGNVPYSQMPDLMNCIDLLILPSVNEGLPLVTVEASRCGAMVIGSDVGGIKEAIGKDNVVTQGVDFTSRFVARCIEAMDGNYKFSVNDNLDWDKTALKEVNIYSDILAK